MNPPLTLSYRLPAENSVSGWERESLPLGNGFLGASVFGGLAQAVGFIDRQTPFFTQSRLAT